MKKPYFRKSHHRWYVNNENGKPVRLNQDEDKAYEIWQRRAMPRQK